METVGIVSGLVPLFVFIVGWLFGVSAVFLRIIALLILVTLLVVIWIKRIKLMVGIHKLIKLRLSTSRINLIVLSLIFAFLVINLIGVIAPETSFDALWYHLTIPKIYLLQGGIDYIPGGLFYYSAMPRLTEIWYLISLAIDNSGTLAKLIHFTYGIGICVIIFQLISRYINRSYGLVGALSFISTLLVCWESGSAYVELSWTFYTVLAVYLYLNYLGTKSVTRLILTGIACGLAIGTKLPAIFTFLVLCSILLKTDYKHRYYFLIATIITSFPWFIFSYIKTGNPIYPFFTDLYPVKNLILSISLVDYARSVFSTLTWPQDPFSIFVGFIGVSFLFIGTRNNVQNKLPVSMDIFFIVSYLVWLIFFHTSGSRFLLPTLPIWIIICLCRYRYLELSNKILYGVLIFSSVLNLGYRSFSISRVIPVILGMESRQDYLLKRLNFDFGDFIDRDGNIKNIVGNDQVLVYGFHNLFYADFSFIHESMISDYGGYRYWLSDKPMFDCQGCELLYSDPPTKVYLYSSPFFGKIRGVKQTQRIMARF